MTPHIDSQYNPKIAGIIDAFINDGAGNGIQNPQPLSLADYKEACKYFLGEQPVLPDALLEARVRYIYDDSKLKEHFKPGYRICPVVIPFSNMGMPLSKDELASGGYLRLLIINKEGRTLAGFGNEVCNTFGMLPTEVQAMACTIGAYDSPLAHVITEGDRTRIAQQYIEAFRKLQAVL